ncbi:MLO-like protein 1 [Aegilops tauschii subsp. strangulata]|uniref:MLO-like protein n=1 Tax=Aegilops tauschii subsp. strangulata TaxID=200361 RepID=A0A453QDI3_AEGTS|nr:MLO-like protein 1 [Aegilops tauschii subsp. strangulata]
MAGGAGGGGAAEITLERTPTWIVASVCSVIVLISLLFERLLHRLGKRLTKGRRKPLYEALLKVKEELMLLGFISLLLTVFQGATQKICVRESLMQHLLPCPRNGAGAAKSVQHYAAGATVFTGVVGSTRRLLAGGGASSDYCLNKGKVPILSIQAIHQLHIFIFVLAATHVILSAITIILGITQTRKWKHWEDKIQQSDDNGPQMVRHVQEFKFIKKHFKGHGRRWEIFGWLRSFFKQFYGSVTEEDYTTLRLGFVMKHSKGHLKFNFYNYMNRALEGDFKKVVGISWYLWAMLMIFLLLNVHGWHVYIWISIAPFILLLLVGSKLEHIITELAIDVAQKNTAIEGELVVALSDEFFWFHRPKLVLLLIHIILFQNAFEIAFFFWLLVTYGFKSCIMGKPAYAIARLVISVIGQLLCGYSTLPLYALISQMGSSFKKAMFDESISEGLANWAHKARKRNTKPAASVGDNSSVGEEIQMTNARRESAI